MKKNILITGCLGFIGFHLTTKLIKNGRYSIHGIDNINNYYDVSLKKARLKILKKDKKFMFKKIDILNKNSLSNLIKTKKIKIIINLAAQAGVRNSITNPKAYLDNNITGFFNILEVSKEQKIEHLIFASTSSVYGNNKNFPLNENDNSDYPLSFYAATKKTNEVMAHSYSNIFKLAITGLRFFTVYGPYGRPDMSLYKFTKAIYDCEHINLFNEGNHIRDFTYIDDVVNGISLIVDKPSIKAIPYEIYNIGSGNPKSLKYFLNVIKKVTNITPKIKLKKFQDGDIYKTHADISKIKKKFNYQPKYDLKTGIQNFVNWYNAYFNNKKPK